MFVLKTGLLWRRSPDRAKYSRVVFEPSNRGMLRGESKTDAHAEDEKVYNLFRGWGWRKFDSMEQVDLSKIQPVIDHIWLVWASGDDRSYNFILQYVAHIFQRPEQKNPTVLHFHGDQGTVSLPPRLIMLKATERASSARPFSVPSSNSTMPFPMTWKSKTRFWCAC